MTEEIPVVSEAIINASTEAKKSMVLHFELIFSLLIQKAVRLHQTVDNNPLLKDIIQIRDSLREDARRLGYKGQF